MNRFTEINTNPKRRNTSDCVIRSLALALEIDADTILKDLTKIYLETGYYASDPKCYGPYLESKGFKRHGQPRKPDRKRYRGYEFCEKLDDNPKVYGVVVAHVGNGHLSTMKNIKEDPERYYTVHDTWDCSERVVGIYWAKER